MKKRNPISSTVTHVVLSTNGRRKKKNQPKKTKQEKLIDFFGDLENRGPFTPDSLFEKWTRKIRNDMEKAGTWKGNPKSVNFEFVIEYINRLQVLFRNAEKGHSSIYEYVNGKWEGEFTREGFAFRMIYLKIRVWGLRTRQFRLRRWLKRDSWIDIHRETILFPIDFSVKYRAGEKAHRYVVSFFSKRRVQKETYVNKTLKKTIDLHVK